MLHKLVMAGMMRLHRLLEMLKPVAPGLNVELPSELEEVGEGGVAKLQHLRGVEKAELHVNGVAVGEVIVVELYVQEAEVVPVEHYA